MNLASLNIFANLFNNLLPKIADGNLRQKLKTEIQRLEIEFQF